MTIPSSAPHLTPESAALQSQANARSRLAPLHAILRAHRARWLEQEPREPTRRKWLTPLVFAICGVGVTMSQLSRNPTVVYSGLALVIVTVMALVWSGITEMKRGHGGMARGEDDPEGAERSSVSIAALREDLLLFGGQDLTDVITGRARRLEKKSAFSASSTVWIPIWATVVTVLTALIQLLWPLLKESFKAVLSIPFLGQAVVSVGVGLTVGTVVALILLLSATAESRAWLEWELEALRQARAVKVKGEGAATD